MACHFDYHFFSLKLHRLKIMTPTEKSLAIRLRFPDWIFGCVLNYLYILTQLKVTEKTGWQVKKRSNFFKYNSKIMSSPTIMDGK